MQVEYKCQRCRFKSHIDNQCKALASDYYNIDVEMIEDLQYEDCGQFFSNDDAENYSNEMDEGLNLY